MEQSSEQTDTEVLETETNDHDDNDDEEDSNTDEDDDQWKIPFSIMISSKLLHLYHVIKCQIYFVCQP